MEKLREKFAVSNAPTYHSRVRLLKKPVERDEENERTLRSNLDRSHNRVDLESLIKVEKAKKIENHQAAGII